MAKQRPKSLARYLKEQSKIICQMNECAKSLRKNGGHNCDSYAYIAADGSLLNICNSDYFQGHSGPCAAIGLPWSGTQKELMEAVAEQCYEEENND